MKNTAAFARLETSYHKADSEITARRNAGENIMLGVRSSVAGRAGSALYVMLIYILPSGSVVNISPRVSPVSQADR